MIKVFVSSTWADLQAEREMVEKALSRMRVRFVGMEYFGSRPDTPKQTCLDEIARSNVYIGIFAHRYGTIDADHGCSLTELEYREARARELPCLIYFKDENVAVIPSHFEADPESRCKLQEFKEQLKKTHTISWFTTPEDLAMQVALDLVGNFLVDSSRREEHVFRVPARLEGGIDTGLLVQPGQRLNISAAGMVSLDSYHHFTNPDGYLCDEAGRRLLHPTMRTTLWYAAEGHYLHGTDGPHRAGALIGWIGEWQEGEAFYIGSANEIEISREGKLFLAVNDLRGAYGDNSGAFEVKVSIRT
jgi:hypothetical protein